MDNRKSVEIGETSIHSEVLLVCMPHGGIREAAGAYESHVRKRKEKKKKKKKQRTVPQYKAEKTEKKRSPE